MLSPALSVTKAFFHVGRRPEKRPTRFSLPRTTTVRTPVTVTLNRVWIAWRISILFASRATSNTTFCAYSSPSAGADAAPPVSRMRAVFSVRRGRLMTDCALRMERLRDRLDGVLGEHERVVAQDVVDVD